MKIKIPILIIELENNNFHVVVTSYFSGKTKGVWIIDTGASKSVFDKNLAVHYNLLNGEAEELHSAGIGEGSLQTSLAILNTIYFKKLRIDNFKVALLDLSHINKLYSTTAKIKICGLMGGDFLMKYKAVIDYKKKVLVLKA